MFERFYRADQARSRRTGGTGLGLAIVKHAVQRHGGDVRLWSREGRGSTFTIRLPMIASPLDEPPRKRARKEKKVKKKQKKLIAADAAAMSGVTAHRTNDAAAQRKNGDTA